MTLHDDADTFLITLVEAMDKKAYLESVDVSFEGYTFKSPSCYDEYLTGIYGDYMQLPPIEKRQTHEMHVTLEDE